MEEPARNLWVWLAAVASVLVVAGSAAAGSGDWTAGRPLPLPRTEVASAVVKGKILVVGGFLADGSSTGRADLYDPVADRWTRLPDLPVAVNHALAASDGRRVYVVGGYSDGRAERAAHVLENGRWRKLPPLPAPRAAGGAAVVAGKLYVVGGTFARGRLARETLVFDPAARRWREAAGLPTPREHLGVAAFAGRVYALGGRTAGFDTNLSALEVFDPRSGRWRSLPDVPSPRGGTGLAAAAGRLVSVGGEAPTGTIASVYAYDVRARRWARLADLPTPRHGLGVEAVGRRVSAIAGGPEPGLTVSGANEALALPWAGAPRAAAARRARAPWPPPP
jgi:non-specific serine/threonine protein kinase